jgi:hypothetical protein
MNKSPQKLSSRKHDSGPQGADHVIRQVSRVQTVQPLPDPESHAQKRHNWRKNVLNSDKNFYQESRCFTCFLVLVQLTVLAYFGFIIALQVLAGPGVNTVWAFLERDFPLLTEASPYHEDGDILTAIGGFNDTLTAIGIFKAVLLIVVTPVGGVFTIWLIIAYGCGAI